jgi:hypothetical protein
MSNFDPLDVAARRRSISPLKIDSPSQLNHPEQNKISEIFSQFIPFIDTIESSDEENLTFKNFENQNLSGNLPTRELQITIHMAKKRKSRILDDVEFREAYGFVRRKSMTKTQIFTLSRKVKKI